MEAGKPFSLGDVGTGTALFGLVLFWLRRMAVPGARAAALLVAVKLVVAVLYCGYVVYGYHGGDALDLHNYGLSNAEVIRRTWRDGPLTILDELRCTGATASSTTVMCHLSGVTHVLFLNSFL